jgi:hypothetical protein
MAINKFHKSIIHTAISFSLWEYFDLLILFGNIFPYCDLFSSTNFNNSISLNSGIFKYVYLYVFILFLTKGISPDNCFAKYSVVFW